MKYKIITIYNRETGKERTDGRYPLRKGCIMTFTAPLRVGSPMVWDYIFNAKGEPKEGRLSTSDLLQVIENDNILTATTRNSVYVFEKL